MDDYQRGTPLVDETGNESHVMIHHHWMARTQYTAAWCSFIYDMFARACIKYISFTNMSVSYY